MQAVPMLPEAAVGIAELKWGELARRDEVKSLTEH